MTDDHNAATARDTGDTYHLPDDSVPVHYDIVLEPDLDAAIFTGHVAIDIEVRSPVSAIVLNAAELEIRHAAVDGIGAEVSHDPAAERVTLTLPGELGTGPARIEADFTGILNDKLHGFYRSTYTDEEGAEHTLAVTQFESTDARRAFPCYDEPALKATFGVSLVVADGLFAVSNGAEVAAEAMPDGRRKYRFADTMKMSTYLVAFVVGELEATEPVDVNGTPVRIVHRPGRGQLCDFAVEVAAHALAFFEDYYGIAYPGDKLDLIAVPDFAFGAMENLGCVTFREALLLVDPATISQAERTRVADVICHELAHMWFGDLVTMKWWNGIWLNEAFATFMEIAAVDAFRPEWQRWEQFAIERSAAFGIDSLHETRPVEYEVRSPEDADGMFDVLTYQKGASVLRMLEQFIGADTFRDGIRGYLERHAYANTETNDLWDALEEVSGEPVRAMMNTWILQGGYPVIDVASNGVGQSVTLDQRRFLYLHDRSGTQPDAAREAARRRWIVPLIVRPSLAAPAQDRVRLDADSLDVLEAAGVDAFMANAGGHGFYRVAYSDELFATLVENKDRLSSVERYTLVDDFWAQVLAGENQALDFVNMAEAFADETSPDVWRSILTGLESLTRVCEDDALVRLRGRCRRLLDGVYGRLGWEPASGEDERTRELRGLVLESLGVLCADAEVRERARAAHKKFLDDGSNVDPDVVAASVGIIADCGTSEEFDTFVHLFRNAENPQVELRYLYALASFPGATEFEQTMNMADSDAIRTQNAPYLLGKGLTHRDHGAGAWQLISDRWESLIERFPANSIVRMLAGIRSLAHHDIGGNVRSFFETHDVPTGDRTLAQYLEMLEVVEFFREREYERLNAAV